MPHLQQSDWSDQVLKMLVPREYLNDFAINHIEELPDEWIIELVEKEDRIPNTCKNQSALFFSLHFLMMKSIAKECADFMLKCF